MSLNLHALETSFDLVAPRGDELMDEFYGRLFAAAPAVRPLFPQDLRRQKTMLLGALVLLRKSLRDLDSIVPKLRELGARHVGYGARPEHYPVVAVVLVDSMAAVAGDAWTREYRAAWAAAYEVVAATVARRPPDRLVVVRCGGRERQPRPLSASARSRLSCGQRACMS